MADKKKSFPSTSMKPVDVQVKEDIILQHKVGLLTVMLSAFLIGMAIAVSFPPDEPAPEQPVVITAAAVSASLETRYGGKWAVELDETKGIPKSIAIPALAVDAYSDAKSDSTVTKDNAVNLAKEFVRSSADILHVNADDLVESKVWDNTLATDANQRFVITHMRQTYQGVPVETGIVSALFHNNELVNYNSSWYPDVSVPTVVPAITVEQAFDAAKQSELALYTDSAQTPKEEDMKLAASELVIVPLISNTGNTYRLAWKVSFEDIVSPLLALTYYIDASSGLVIHRINHIHSAISGYILGGMYPENPTKGREENVDFTGSVVRAENISGAPVFYGETDNQGRYSLNVESGNTYRVEYNFFNTTSTSNTLITGNSENGGDSYVSQNMSAPGVYTVNWENEDTTYKKEASNVFYHIRKIKDFFNDSSQGTPFDIPGQGDEFYVNAIIASEDDPCNAEIAGFVLKFAPSSSDCEATSLGSDIIYHEFSHLITSFIYSPNFLGDTGEEGALAEALPDYWAASITDNSVIGEDVISSVFQRNLQNTLRYSEMGPADEAHTNSQIVSGALWDFRTKMIERYGIDEGIRKADERVVMAMKFLPRDFWQVMEALMYADDDFGTPADGTPHMREICDAFSLNHGIWHPYCDTIDIETPTLGWNSFGIPVDGTFISSSPSLFPLIGSAAAPNQQTQFQSYSVDYRGLNKPAWGTEGVSLASGGSQPVDTGQLGTIEQDKLIPGCFYNARLNVETSTGVTSTGVTFQKLPGTQPSMPRMVCVYRTANEGSENDACETVALVSDPKPAYYSMSTNDWRRGRDWRLVQGAAGLGQIVPRYGMCDPDFGGDSCADDCWNISGTNGNATDGNNGWDNVFCKAGTGCSPVSFSGCPADDASCIENAITNLESVYHKVVYLHWANENYDLADCSDDNGLQMYTNLTVWRVGQCSYPRCEKIFPGDVLDGFDKLSGNTGSDGRFLLFYESAQGRTRHMTPEPRVSETPATKCATCGCPGASPYCNSSADVCEQKCWDGQPFNTCKPVTVNGVSAASYCKLEDYATYQTKYACGSLCPGVQCPTVADNFATPVKLFCNTSIGYCVKCNSNADCNDNSSCTTDVCVNPGQLNSSCTHDRAFPNDCSTSQVCGSSPSGCYTCGSCGVGKICKNSSCVRDPNYTCNPLKERCDFIKPVY